jgi:DNA polymerase III subunit delta'
MAFSDFPDQEPNVQLLQSSLERGRLAHAYLFDGHDLTQLEAMAGTLAKTLNCEKPPRRGKSGYAVDCCDQCLTCRKIQNCNHPDVLWIRPESKSRVITIDQMRELMQTVQLKPGQAQWKIGVIVAADRLNQQAANAFLKTLEEPPGQSILILLTTEPGQILETLLSRCLRLRFTGESARLKDPAFLSWLAQFSELASGEQKTLLNRYRLLSLLLTRLGEIKATVQQSLAARSPLEKYEDIDSRQRDKWEEELEAAIEAEYRRERADLLVGLQWWLRDVWIQTLNFDGTTYTFPNLAPASRTVATRIDPPKGIRNVEIVDQVLRWLSGNVQEALALEIGLLKLAL